MTKLEVAIIAYNTISNREVYSRVVEGDFSESDYQTQKKELEQNSLLINCHDELRTVEFSLPHEKEGFFALSMDELLEADERLLSPPKTFYIANRDYLFTPNETNIPEDVQNYFDTATFASKLHDLADHRIETSLKAIFLQGEKLELSLKYSLEDLKPLPGLHDFISEFVDAEIHRTQKATIIKGVLLEMLKSSEIESFTLPSLINRFSEFLDRVHANYELYVSEFSFEKIKSQVESEKFEFTLKLNKVFSEIQNQLLAVPVALILVGSQMKTHDGISLHNLTVWSGALVFGFLLSLLIRNQRSTLNAIKLEFDAQWGEIKHKHQLVVERLSHHYDQIERRYRVQRVLLFLVSFIIAVSIGISTVLLLYSSNAVSEYQEVLKYGSYGGLIYLAGCLVWLKASKTSKG